MEAGRGGKLPLDVITLGLTGTWAHIEDGKGGKPYRGRQTQLAEKPLWAACHGREEQTSVSGWWAGAPSKWTVALQLGDKGGEETGAKIEGPLDGRTLGYTRTWAQVEDGMGGE